MRFITFLQLARASNLPTVWTNTLAAGCLSLSLVSTGHHSAVTWLLVLVCMSLFYVAGMLQNDVFDAEWDKEHRNDRPIAQGLANAASVRKLSWALLVIAMGLLPTISLLSAAVNAHIAGAMLAGLALASSIYCYNQWHKRITASIWLMGLCRALLYLCVGTVIAGINSQLVIAAVLLGGYIAAVTLLARNENQPQSSVVIRGWALLCLCSPLLLALFIPFNLLAGIPAAMFLAWIGWHLKQVLVEKRKPIGALIGALLAALPLIDAWYLALLQQYWAMGFCIGTFLIIPKLQKWIKPT